MAATGRAVVDTIVAGGRFVRVPGLRVVGLGEGPAFFALGRRASTTAVVLHWTGGVGDPKQVYRTLRARGVSVHFCVGADAVVYQYADADRRCAHAGQVDDSDCDGRQLSANATTIGIEIVSPGVENPHHLPSCPTMIVSAMPCR